MSGTIQDNYNLYPEAGYEGLIATSERANVKSRAVEDAAGIDFGRGVVTGTDAGVQVKIPTADTDKFEGITVHTHNVAGMYEEAESAGVLTKGVVMVKPVVAVSYGEKAYLIATGANAGKFTNVAAGNIDTKGTFVKTQAVANELSEIELNNPQA